MSHQGVHNRARSIRSRYFTALLTRNRGRQGLHGVDRAAVCRRLSGCTIACRLRSRLRCPNDALRQRRKTQHPPRPVSRSASRHARRMWVNVDRRLASRPACRFWPAGNIVGPCRSMSRNRSGNVCKSNFGDSRRRQGSSTCPPPQASLTVQTRNLVDRRMSPATIHSCVISSRTSTWFPSAENDSDMHFRSIERRITLECDW